MIPQLHASNLGDMMMCGYRFYLGHIEGIQRPRTVRMVIGTAVDRSVTVNMQHKIDHDGKMVPSNLAMDLAREAIVEEFALADVRADHEDTEDGLKASKGEAIDAAVALADLHHRDVAPGIHPTHSQWPFCLDIHGLDGERQMQLAGTIDIREGLDVVDTKTSGKAPAKNVADRSDQLDMYALAIATIKGVDVVRLRLDYLVRTPKRHDIYAEPRPTMRLRKDLRPIARRIQAAARMIEANIFPPASPESWWCSEKWCGYWDICPYAKRPMSVTVQQDLGDLLSQSLVQIETKRTADSIFQQMALTANEEHAPIVIPLTVPPREAQNFIDRCFAESLPPLSDEASTAEKVEQAAIQTEAEDIRE